MMTSEMESLDRAVEEAREGITEAVGAACSLAYRRGEFIGFGVRWGPDIDRISRAQDRVDSILEKRSKAFEAAVSAKARAEERERQKQFHAADGAGMVYASKAAAGMIERIINEEDAYYHGVPWEEIRRWIKRGEDLWAIYLIGEAHMLATDHQSEVAALSVAGRRGIDQWRARSSEEARNGG